MTPNETRIVVQLLRLAYDEFVNHCCNDFPLSDTPENRQLWHEVVGCEPGDPEFREPPVVDGQIYFADASLMNHFAQKLEEAPAMEGHKFWAATYLDGMEDRPEMWASTLVSLEESYWVALDAYYMLESGRVGIVRQAWEDVSKAYFGDGNHSLAFTLSPDDFEGLVVRLKRLRERAHAIATERKVKAQGGAENSGA